MLAMLLVPPAVTQSTPATTKLIEGLLETLEGIPEAFIEGTPAVLPELLRKLKGQWEAARKPLAAAFPAGEIEAIGQRLAALPSLRPHEQAESALEASALLAGRAAPCRAIFLENADRVTMLAWCRVDARRWDAIPDVAEAFRPLLEGEGGRHRETVEDIRASLERLRGDRADSFTDTP